MSSIYTAVSRFTYDCTVCAVRLFVDARAYNFFFFVVVSLFYANHSIIVHGFFKPRVQLPLNYGGLVDFDSSFKSRTIAPCIEGEARAIVPRPY